MKAACALSAGLLLCACGQAAQAEQRWYCGEAFAINLGPDESIETTSPVEDFVLHRLATRTGLVIIYEGNAPQPADDVVATGMDWPQAIAIHDDRMREGNRGGIRSRLLIGRGKSSVCPPTSTAGRQE